MSGFIQSGRFGGASQTAYRYWRWTVSSPTGASLIQSSEFMPIVAGSRVAPLSASGSSFDGTQVPACLIDNSSTTKWLCSGTNHVASPVIIDMGSAVAVEEYLWTTANDAPERDPAAWTLDGSNDGSSWTTVSTVSGHTSPGQRTQIGGLWPVDSFAQGGSGYRFYALNVATVRSGSELQLSEFNVLSGGSRVASAIAFPKNTASGGEGSPKLDDNNTSTKLFIIPTALPMRLILQMATRTTVDAYRWYTGNDSTGRDPMTWTFEGSNDAISWTVLDTQSSPSVTTSRQALVGPFSI